MNTMETPICQVPLGELLKVAKEQGPLNVPTVFVPFGKYMEMERAVSISTGWINSVIVALLTLSIAAYFQRRGKRKAAKVVAAGPEVFYPDAVIGQLYKATYHGRLDTCASHPPGVSHPPCWTIEKAE